MGHASLGACWLRDACTDRACGLRRCLVPAEQLAAEQSLPGKSLEAVMTSLRRAGLVLSQRGPGGGFSLARPASEITLAEIVEALNTF
jgi:Rrf2 family protein